VSETREPVTPQVRKPWRKLPLIGGVAAVMFAIGAVVVPLINRTTTDSTDLTGRIDRVAVLSDNGRVEIVATDIASARVAATRRYSLSRPEVVSFVRGGTLSVRAACPGWAFLSCSTDLRVEVPRGTDVRVRVSGGDVVVTAVEGTVFVRSASGSVRITDVRARRIDVGTVADDVTIDAATPPREVTAFSEAGTVEISVPAGPYRVAASSTQGTERIGPGITSRPDADSRIDGRSKLGDVMVFARG
jgi:Putative adhesin